MMFLPGPVFIVFPSACQKYLQLFDTCFVLMNLHRKVQFLCICVQWQCTNSL